MDLIAISSSRIGAQEVQTVNARDLHAFLGVKKDFTDWIKDQILRARLVENRDYVVFPQQGESGGKPRSEYHLTIDAGKHIAMMSQTENGFEVRDYFIECERRAVAAAQAQPAPAPAELSRMDILRLALESEEARLKAEAERDEAIRTKALIGSKREATAMATASAAKRETAKLREELGACARHATITAVQIATGTEYKFAPMRRWCAANGATPVDVPDKRYGKVKAWPAAAWAICHDVDLSALFGEVAP